MIYFTCIVLISLTWALSVLSVLGAVVGDCCGTIAAVHAAVHARAWSRACAAP